MYIHGAALVQPTGQMNDLFEWMNREKENVHRWYLYFIEFVFIHPLQMEMVIKLGYGRLHFYMVSVNFQYIAARVN